MLDLSGINPRFASDGGIVQKILVFSLQFSVKKGFFVESFSGAVLLLENEENVRP
jgi:hypothetical protein